MKILRKIFFILSIILFIGHTNAKEPIEFISEITQTASNILKENISVDDKVDKLVLIAESAVDIDGIGL